MQPPVQGMPGVQPPTQDQGMGAKLKQESQSGQPQHLPFTTGTADTSAAAALSPGPLAGVNSEFTRGGL